MPSRIAANDRQDPQLGILEEDREIEIREARAEWVGVNMRVAAPRLEGTQVGSKIHGVLTSFEDVGNLATRQEVDQTREFGPGLRGLAAEGLT